MRYFVGILAIVHGWMAHAQEGWWAVLGIAMALFIMWCALRMQRDHTRERCFEEVMAEGGDRISGCL